MNSGGQPVHKDDSEFGLWSRWREHKDMAAREALIDLHLAEVRIVAASMYAKRYSDEIEFADYQQLATIGLLESIERFDPGLGNKFSTFAGPRMRGAILNGLEVQTEKQQQLSMRKRLQEQRLLAVKEGVRTEAGGQQVASDQVFSRLAEIGIGLALSWLLEDTGLAEAVDVVEELPFYKSVELKQLQERVKALLKTLPVREQKVIRYHYLQNIPFEEIADIMSLSRGRISQLHTMALKNLRNRVRTENGCDLIY